MAETISPDELKGKIREKLDVLEPLSPRKIGEEIGGNRRKLNKPEAKLGNWLSEVLGVPKISLKTRQDVRANLVVEVTTTNYVLTYEFLVGTSLMEFLGDKKQDVSLGITMSPECAFLIRALVDRRQGIEGDVAKAAMAIGLSQLPMMCDFIEQLQQHSEWRTSMHEAGLYPAEVDYAWAEIAKEAKKQLGQEE